MVCHASALAWVGPPVIFIQAQLFCAISSHSHYVPLDNTPPRFGAPLPTSSETFIFVHFFTQSFSSFRSTCPNHLKLALWILPSTHSMPKQLISSSLRFLFLKDTPHIFYNIILSALPILVRSSTFTAHTWRFSVSQWQATSPWQTTYQMYSRRPDRRCMLFGSLDPMEWMRKISTRSSAHLS